MINIQNVIDYKKMNALLTLTNEYIESFRNRIDPKLRDTLVMMMDKLDFQFFSDEIPYFNIVLEEITQNENKVIKRNILTLSDILSNGSDYRVKLHIRFPLFWFKSEKNLKAILNFPNILKTPFKTIKYFSFGNFFKYVGFSVDAETLKSKLHHNLLEYQSNIATVTFSQTKSPYKCAFYDGFEDQLLSFKMMKDDKLENIKFSGFNVECFDITDWFKKIIQEKPSMFICFFETMLNSIRISDEFIDYVYKSEKENLSNGNKV